MLYQNARRRRSHLRELKSMTPIERARIIELDGRSCRICGRGVGLEVHHIDGECLEASSEAYNHDGNLITLCHHCHSGITMLELKYPEIYLGFVREKLLSLARNR